MNEIKSRETAVIIKEVMLAEDLWTECSYKGWDKGDLWDEKIAPNNKDDLLMVKILISLNEGQILLDVEKITKEMIDRAIGSPSISNKKEEINGKSL